MAKTTDIVRSFDSWSEYVDYAVSHADKSAASHDEERGPEWDQGVGWAKALKMARTDGYKQAMAEVEGVSGAVTKQIDTTFFQSTFESAYGHEGAEVDMGRFLSGEPECMIQSQPIRIARAGRAVRILVPMTASWNVETSTFLRRGAAIMALCDVLQKAQHPLEVWVGITVTPGHGRPSERKHTQLVRIQSANEPLDEGRLCYALAHPTMLRRLGFAVKEGETHAVRQAFGFHNGGGYGSPTPTSPDVLPDQAGNTIVLPKLEGNEGWSIEESVAWIESELEKIFSDAE